MDLNTLKTQVMTMFLMRPNENKQNDMFGLIYSMLIMNIVEYIFRSGPAISAFLMLLVNKLWSRKDKQGTLADILKKEKTDVNSISMTRTFNSKESKNEKADNVFVEKVDAVLDYICALDSAKHIRLDTRYSLNNVDEIELTQMMKAKVKQMFGKDDENVIELMIFSSKLKVSEIRRWIDEIHENYVAEKNNKLGNKIFYFNEQPYEPIVQQELMPDGTTIKSYRWDNMPKMLCFNMNEFKTSKSFKNVYGNHVNELKERLDLFINHSDWYLDRGIPHSLGIMLHGIPGAGKTSTIKAIAKDTNRHIFNLSLRPYTSQRQLTNLFFNETVVVMGYDGNKMMYKIPLNKRVYVIEDIDCLTDVVLDRKLQKEKTKEDESVSLSFLLNLLDGVLETPGRILIITSNYPEKLDKALIRPGRIDVKIEFNKATCEFIADMVNHFYNIDKKETDIPLELDGIFTPAEVMEGLCMYFKDVEKALQHLVKKSKEKVGTLILDLELEKGTTTTENIGTKENCEHTQTIIQDVSPEEKDPKVAPFNIQRIVSHEEEEKDQKVIQRIVSHKEEEKDPKVARFVKPETPKDPKVERFNSKTFKTLEPFSYSLNNFADAQFEDTPFLDPNALLPSQSNPTSKMNYDLNMVN